MSQADLVARQPIRPSPDVMAIRDLFEVDLIARRPFAASPDAVAYRDNHVMFPSSAVALPTIFGEFAATFAIPTMSATGQGPQSTTAWARGVPSGRATRSGRGGRGGRR